MSGDYVSSAHLNFGISMPNTPAARRVLGQGKFLKLVCDGKWEIAERVNARGAVAVIAVTDARQFILTEQFRPAVGRQVIDLPAGLSGDVIGQEDESGSAAASRELIEETGFEAAELCHLANCPSSPGLTSEMVSYFMANGVRRVAAGGGVGNEKIEIQLPKLRSIRKWLAEQVALGKLIDPKVYVGLYFISIDRRRL